MLFYIIICVWYLNMVLSSAVNELGQFEQVSNFDTMNFEKNSFSNF